MRLATWSLGLLLTERLCKSHRGERRGRHGSRRFLPASTMLSAAQARGRVEEGVVGQPGW